MVEHELHLRFIESAAACHKLALAGTEGYSISRDSSTLVTNAAGASAALSRMAADYCFDAPRSHGRSVFLGWTPT